MDLVTDTVFVIVPVMLTASMVLTMVRLLRGPHTLDRIAALDVFVVLVVAGTSVYVAFYADGSNITARARASPPDRWSCSARASPRTASSSPPPCN